MSLPGDPRSRPARGTGDVLVTGATGLLGRAVCRALGERRIHHRAFVRPTSDRGALDGSGPYTWMIEGDLLRPETLGAACDGVRVILHLAGLVRSSDVAACSALHLGGTRALSEATAAARIVAMSSDTVSRAHRGGYAQSKANMEEWLRQRGNAVVLRPPMILGPGSPHLASLEKAARLPVVPLPDGVARRAPVHVDDVACAVLAAMDLPDDALADGALIFDLPGADEMPFGEMIQELARARGWRIPWVMHVPAPLSSGALRIIERLGPRERAEKIRRRVDGMRESVHPDGAPARRQLGWSPRPLTEVLQGA